LAVRALGTAGRETFRHAQAVDDDIQKTSDNKTEDEKNDKHAIFILISQGYFTTKLEYIKEAVLSASYNKLAVCQFRLGRQIGKQKNRAC
jgi:hypothetical protein